MARGARARRTCCLWSPGSVSGRLTGSSGSSPHFFSVSFSGAAVRGASERERATDGAPPIERVGAAAIVKYCCLRLPRLHCLALLAADCLAWLVHWQAGGLPGAAWTWWSRSRLLTAVAARRLSLSLLLLPPLARSRSQQLALSLPADDGGRRRPTLYRQPSQRGRCLSLSASRRGRQDGGQRGGKAIYDCRDREAPPLTLGPGNTRTTTATDKKTQKRRTRARTSAHQIRERASAGVHIIV